MFAMLTLLTSFVLHHFDAGTGWWVVFWVIVAIMSYRTID